MRLVAVSIVKNEGDIIEAFVRHTQAWVDHHLIFDHDSTDGTRQILGALKSEGLALTLFTDNALGNLQQFRSNHLTHLAARDYTADWIIPLDADEILSGSGRTDLETALGQIQTGFPASLPLLNYYPTAEDDGSILNPVVRLRFCQASQPRTRKIIVPRGLALAPEISAGKGSHALYRGNEALPDRPLPSGFHLSHLALRSQQHQALRVTLAELQKLSRGQAHAGLDLHYRLGFQLLSENPDLFFNTVCVPPSSLKLQPIKYHGAPLNPALASSGWERVAKALLPYLEKLALSHGRLLDETRGNAFPEANLNPTIRELDEGEVHLPTEKTATHYFSGFSAVSGWGPQEGPVPEAFLPAFHWGYAPATVVSVHSPFPREARMTADVLTYSEQQKVQVTVNGVAVLEQGFSRTNQKERLTAPLPLIAGENQLSFHYSQALVTEHDRRRLAMIFLSLRITQPG